MSNSLNTVATSSCSGANTPWTSRTRSGTERRTCLRPLIPRSPWRRPLRQSQQRNAQEPRDHDERNDPGNRTQLARWRGRWDATLGWTKRPRRKGDDREDEGDHPLVRTVAHQKVGCHSARISKDGTGVGPFLEPWKARNEERHGTGELPDAEDQEKVMRVVQVIEAPTYDFDPEQVPHRSRNHFPGDDRRAYPVGDDAEGQTASSTRRVRALHLCLRGWSPGALRTIVGGCWSMRPQSHGVGPTGPDTLRRPSIFIPRSHPFLAFRHSNDERESSDVTEWMGVQQRRGVTPDQRRRGMPRHAHQGCRARGGDVGTPELGLRLGGTL